MSIEDVKRIHRTYHDTEVTNIAVNVECPHCGREWLEPDPECGETYKLTCDEDDDGCGRGFEMYFDAS
ncbi:hypothetical protein D3C73_1013520 [compost metagenome]